MESNEIKRIIPFDDIWDNLNAVSYTHLTLEKDFDQSLPRLLESLEMKLKILTKL